MTGTEKQVQWAEAIRAEFAGKFTSLRAEYEQAADRAVKLGKATPEIAEAGREKLLGQIDAVLARTEAAWWIEQRAESSRGIINVNEGRPGTVAH